MDAVLPIYDSQLVLQLLSNDCFLGVLGRLVRENFSFELLEELKCAEVEDLLGRVVKVKVHCMHNLIEERLVQELLGSKSLDKLGEV